MGWGIWMLEVNTLLCMKMLVIFFVKYYLNIYITIGGKSVGSAGLSYDSCQTLMNLTKYFPIIRPTCLA